MLTIMHTIRQLFGNNFTTTGARLRGPSGVDFDHRPTSVLCFVGGECNDLTPGNIGNAFGDGLETVLLHVCHVQIFKYDDLIAIDKLSTDFMRKVLASIRNAGMHVMQSTKRLASFRLPVGNRETLR